MEVFPLSPFRRVAVIEGPRGPFSTESRTPAAIADEVARSVETVLGGGYSWHFVDERGVAWDPMSAEEQLYRMLRHPGAPAAER